MDPQKVLAILEWPTPSDRNGVQRFISFTNFNRRFIKNFLTIIVPNTKLTHLHTCFIWSQEAQAAFEQLKTLFTSAPVLQHLDPALPFVLEVDASEVATGAVLSQRLCPKALLHPVAFCSKKLSQAQVTQSPKFPKLIKKLIFFYYWMYFWTFDRRESRSCVRGIWVQLCTTSQKNDLAMKGVNVPGGEVVKGF